MADSRARTTGVEVRVKTADEEIKLSVTVSLSAKISECQRLRQESASSPNPSLRAHPAPTNYGRRITVRAKG